MTTAISPFRIAVGDDVLEDLRTRLRRTRWPEAELVDDWSQGAPLRWIKDVCQYWAETYDWRQREARLTVTPSGMSNSCPLKIASTALSARRRSRPEGPFFENAIQSIAAWSSSLVACTASKTKTPNGTSSCSTL